MSIIVFAETQNKQLKKSAFEALTYGKKLSEQSGLPLKAIVLGPTENVSDAAEYGSGDIYYDASDVFTPFDSQVYSTAIADAYHKLSGTILVFSHSSLGKSIAGRVAIKLKAGLVAGANDIPTNNAIPKAVFSGKAIGYYTISTDNKVISVMGNAIKPEKSPTPANVQTIDLEKITAKIKVTNRSEASGKVPLPEATRVVSAGRGMKDPANWGIVEELAEALDATLACSRPVADAGWRPHGEHVGQTGIAIRPNLYIAIGISGAIQHLAGVNNSKTIVVINKDPEAPFFKAADYGIVGDLFEIVPKMTEAVKKLKAGTL